MADRSNTKGYMAGAALATAIVAITKLFHNADTGDRFFEGLMKTLERYKKSTDNDRAFRRRLSAGTRD